MKKTSIFLAGIALLGLCACGGNSTAQASASAKASEAPTSQISVAPTEEKYKVTFNLNYDGAPSATVSEVEKGANAQKIADPARDGYVFDNWYTDAACTAAYDFSTAVTADITLYAGWIVKDANMITIKFNYNYEGAPDNGVYLTSYSKKNRKTSLPTNPVREGYYFRGWYTDAECTAEFDFGTILSADTEIYACWLHEYIFEAEYVDFTNKLGLGYSGSSQETDMISEDRSGDSGASNGYYVSWLYYNGANLEWHIDASADVENVVFIARFSVEFYDVTIDDTNYAITVNDTELTGYSVNLSGAYAVGSAGIRPFQDYLISLTASFKAGENIVKLTTDNSDSLGGTMQSKAPVIDCIKLATNDASFDYTEGYKFTDNV